MYNQAESIIRSKVDSGQAVDYKVDAIYGSAADAIPTGIQVMAMAEEGNGDCWVLALSFPNPTNLNRC